MFLSVDEKERCWETAEIKVIASLVSLWVLEGMLDKGNTKEKKKKKRKGRVVEMIKGKKCGCDINES